MAVAVGRVAHGQRVSAVEHLHELRGRLIVSLAAVAVAFGLCMWQNHALLRFIDAPLEHQTERQARSGNGPLGAGYAAQRDAGAVQQELAALLATLRRPDSGLAPGARTRVAALAPQVSAEARRLAAPPRGQRPVTLGVGEPFTSTITVAFLFALTLSLPLLLFELYGFVVPAFSPHQRRLAAPLMAAVPLLFAAGVAFGYLVVLPAAVRFLTNFNSGQFDVLVQAGQYYHFAAVTLLAMGLVFQIPVGILAVTRAGIVTPRTLRRNRRYAIVACGAVAALLPGDAVTLVLETVPLYLLFELGVLIASVAERRQRRRGEAPAAPPGGR